MINIDCDELSSNLDLPFLAVDKIEVNTLGKVRRSIGGKTFFNRVGRDYKYECLSAVYSDADREKLLDMDNMVVIIEGNIEGDYNFGDKADGFRIENIKIGKFSLKNGWYHVSFDLMDYGSI